MGVLGGFTRRVALAIARVLCSGSVGPRRSLGQLAGGGEVFAFSPGFRGSLRMARLFRKGLTNTAQTPEKLMGPARGATGFRGGRESGARSVLVRRVSFAEVDRRRRSKEARIPIRTLGKPRRGRGERGSRPWMIIALRARHPRVLGVETARSAGRGCGRSHGDNAPTTGRACVQNKRVRGGLTIGVRKGVRSCGSFCRGKALWIGANFVASRRRGGIDLAALTASVATLRGP